MVIQASVVVPTVPSHPEEVVRFASAVHDHPGLVRLWQGQSYGMDPLATFAYLAGRGLRMAYGTSVVVAGLQHPVRAALDARSLSVMSGSSALYCFGPGSTKTAVALHGAASPAPVAQMRTYLTATRTALHQRDHTGDGLALDGGATGDQLLYQIPAPPSLLGLGVLRPAMARLAGECADAAVTWLCTTRYIRDHLAAPMEQAAAEHGRPSPRRVAMVGAAVHRPGRDRLQLAHLAVGGHLAEPHYRDVATRSGIELDDLDYPEALKAAIDGGLFCYGSAAQIAAHMASYQQCGVAEVALHLSATASLYGLESATDDLMEILEELEKIDG